MKKQQTITALLCAAAFGLFMAQAAPAAAQQSEGQKLRVQSGPTTGAQKSFELDLGRLARQKKMEAQRMAGKMERDWKRKQRAYNRKAGRKVPASGTTADKNFAALNR